MVMGWVAVLLMVVAVAARGLGLVFHGVGVRVAGLGARVAKDLFDCGTGGLGLVFHATGLGRYGGDARCCCCAHDWLSFRIARLGGRVAGLGARVAKHLWDWCCAWAWIGFPCCWAGSLCW